MLSFIGAIIIGGLAGWVAKLIMPGRDPGGLLITVALGIVGAMVATWLGHQVGFYQYGESAGFVGAVVGALILLALYRVVRGNRTV